MRPTPSIGIRVLSAGLGLVLTGCAHHVPLSDSDRARLAKEPAIHVLHYESPLPAVKLAAKADGPTPAEVRRTAGTDPAAQIAQAFTRLIGKKYRLRNLKAETRPLPAPPAKDPAVHKAKYRDGLVMEVWVERWAFAPAPGGTAGQNLELTGRARLAQPADGRVLWLSKTCQVGSGSHNTRLAAVDLADRARLRKTIAAARDECARQLARDFAASGNRK